VLGDGSSILFWKDHWVESVPFTTRINRLYELAENKLVSIADMYNLGWGVDGEAWKWSCRLFA